MFLNSLNHFRAIAIAMIVAGHCAYLIGARFDTFLERLFFSLISGGTALFVFISGFLFHYIFYKRYSFKTFMLGKIKKVLLPYSLFSILPISYVLFARVGYYSDFSSAGNSFIRDYVIPAVQYYLTGSFAIAYWYIPFVMVIFLMSPLHIAFIKTPFKGQILITFLLFVVSLFLHRPVGNIAVAQSVVYFTPVYLFGILCSEKKEIIYSKLKNKEIYVLLLLASVAVLQVVLGHAGSYAKAPFAYDGIDLMLIQKVLLCLFFMVWLHRFEALDSRPINALASTSFAIFFMHSYFVMVGEKLFEALGTPAGSPLLWCAFLTTVVVLVCLGLALGVKKLIPTYSRYVVGY